MNKLIKVLTTAFGLWTSHWLMFWIESFFPQNIYLNDSVLFVYPPVIIIIVSIYLFFLGKKIDAMSVIIGGLIYYLALLFVVAWGISEMGGCTRYFFNLFTTCQ